MRKSRIAAPVITGRYPSCCRRLMCGSFLPHSMPRVIAAISPRRHGASCSCWKIGACRGRNVLESGWSGSDCRTARGNRQVSRPGSTGVILRFLAILPEADASGSPCSFSPFLLFSPFSPFSPLPRRPRQTIDVPGGRVTITIEASTAGSSKAGPQSITIAGPPAAKIISRKTRKSRLLPIRDGTMKPHADFALVKASPFSRKTAARSQLPRAER